MIKKNNLFKIIAFMLFAMLSISAAYSAGGLNVVLSSQNPDPVSPGNFVYVNVKVSNGGNQDLKDVTIELIENSNFEVAQGSDSFKELGVIPAYSNLDTSNNFVIAKFKILVDEKTPLGLNTLEFEVKDSGKAYTYDFDVLVQDANPSIRVSDFKVENLEPGKSSKLIVEVENDNNVALRDVIISLDLDEVEDGVFSTISGSNQKIISSLKANEKLSVEYEIVANPDASSKPYLVPVTINYEDSLGNAYTSEGLGSILVYSSPQLNVNLDSQDSFSGGSNKVTLAVSNPGTSTIKGTQIEFLDSEDYEILEGKFQYVGDLNPDDFQTIQSQLYVKSEDDAMVKVKVTYLDSYNVVNEEIIDVNVQVFSNDELKQFGLAAAGSSGLSSFFGFLVVIALLVGIYYFGKRRGYNKGKSKK